MSSSHRLCAAASVGAVFATLVLLPAAGFAADRPSLERGRYIAMTAGCNDCHTAGYGETAGRVPESEWLKGTALGWSGPWGTTYASNLRIFVGKLTEDEWVTFGRTAQLRPPMPWFALRDMTESDLRSIYRYVKSLAPTGEPAPAYLPPGVTPTGPYVQFVLPSAARAAKAH